MLGSCPQAQDSINNSVRDWVPTHWMNPKLDQSLLGHSLSLCSIFVPVIFFFFEMGDMEKSGAEEHICKIILHPDWKTGFIF